jgi:hypothetical protein
MDDMQINDKIRLYILISCTSPDTKHEISVLPARHGHALTSLVLVLVLNPAQKFAAG